MEKVKIHYNKDGWLCNRYPYDITIDDESRFIEVDEQTHDKTLGCDKHFSWRVKNGKLCHERYEDTPEEVLLQELRDRREEICFPIINRGQAWYKSLTWGQQDKLQEWYKSWLDVTKTKIEPPAPRWLFSSKKDGE